jgi:hypothetical protein
MIDDFTGGWPMLADILNIVKNGKTVSVEELSTLINQRQETTGAALEQLARMGCLSLSSANDCAFGCTSRSCAGCAIRRGGPNIRWYSVSSPEDCRT